jgi:hypothetical protein
MKEECAMTADFFFSQGSRPLVCVECVAVTWSSWRSDLVVCPSVFLHIHNATDRRIVHAHDAPDFGQAVAVFLMGTANGLIAPCAVGGGSSAEQPVQLRSGRKPLLSWNLLEWALVPESRHKMFDEALAAQEHLPLDVLPGLRPRPSATNARYFRCAAGR